MKNPDLRVKAVCYLKEQADKVIHKPHELRYSAKQVATAIDGYAGALGQVADLVVNDLQSMGVDCTYLRNRNPKIFVLGVKDKKTVVQA